MHSSLEGVFDYEPTYIIIPPSYIPLVKIPDFRGKYFRISRVPTY